MVPSRFNAFENIAESGAVGAALLNEAITPPAQQLDLVNRAALLAEARRVLTEEATALSLCADRLSEDALGEAAGLLVNCRGRIVVTGMGKSGAIGRKMAGTLSSTGSPSLFLHPAEGLHGDLGVLSREDVVVAFSYSGETDELIAILPAIGRLGAPIVAFTSRSKSTLGRASKIVLDVSVEREACPMNLAPTTSTTVMLGLSDALALVVMQAKNFTRSDYALIHPAGSLGRRLILRVKDVMRTGDDVAIAPETMTLMEVSFAIQRAHAGAAIVVNTLGKMVGIVTDGDFRRRVLADRNSLDQPVSMLMNRTPGYVTADILAAEGLVKLEEFHPDPGATVGEAPVVDEQTVKPVGMLTLKDLVRAGIATSL